jgi:phosphoglycerate kinase
MASFRTIPYQRIASHHKKIIGDGGRLILMSHLGRLREKVAPEYSLKPVAAKLSDLIGKSVKFAEVVSARKPPSAAGRCEMEKCCFWKPPISCRRGKKRSEFSKKWRALGDIYVNDAFGSAHRAHASTEGLTKYIKTCVAGF